MVWLVALKNDGWDIVLRYKKVNCFLKKHTNNHIRIVFVDCAEKILLHTAGILCFRNMLNKVAVNLIIINKSYIKRSNGSNEHVSLF